MFDVGNVLIRWDPVAAIAAGVGDEEARRFLAAEDFDFFAWNHEQDAGRTWSQAEQAAAASHPHWAAHARAYRANFDLAIADPVPGTADIVRTLHAAGVRLLALTNWSAELFARARSGHDVLALFDDIVVSGEERVAKPDAAIFEVLAERVGRPMDRCVYVDDSARNVAAGARAGLDAVVFTDADRLRADLRLRGLPV